jgi:hypothetical protein
VDRRRAVHDLYVAARAEQPGVNHSTLWSQAARSYYSWTGRVRSHGLQGYVTGHRCRTCRQAMADSKAGRDEHGSCISADGKAHR